MSEMPTEPCRPQPAPDPQRLFGLTQSWLGWMSWQKWEDFEDLEESWEENVRGVSRTLQTTACPPKTLWTHKELDELAEM